MTRLRGGFWLSMAIRESGVERGVKENKLKKINILF